MLSANSFLRREERAAITEELTERRSLRADRATAVYL
jgi:hypothetical protein